MRRSSSVPALHAVIGLPLLAGSLHAQDDRAKATVDEPATGVAFPTSRSGSSQVLLGVGVRAKPVLGVNVNVYAVGLYVDRAKAVPALAKFANRSAAELRADPAFYAALLEKPFDKTLRLVLVRDVAAKDLRAAFAEQLKPRLARASPEDAAAAIESLGDCFKENKLASGTEILLAWRAGGSLVVNVGGAETTVESPPLGPALFGIYLDGDAISPGAKAAFADRVPELLRSAD